MTATSYRRGRKRGKGRPGSPGRPFETAWTGYPTASPERTTVNSPPVPTAYG